MEQPSQGIPTVINTGDIDRGQGSGGLAATIYYHDVDRPAGALALVKLARDREMVGHIVVVVQDLIELALGLGVVGVGAGFLALGGFGRAADDQDSVAVVLHGFQRPERDGVVDLVGSIAWLNRRHV